MNGKTTLLRHPVVKGGCLLKSTEKLCIPEIIENLEAGSKINQMEDFIARLYEWFGLFPLYSKDLGEFLRGWDYSCTEYLAIHWYFYIWILMMVITVLLFALQYDIISGARFKKRGHWLLAALLIVSANFAIAFVVPFVAVVTSSYCPRLKLSVFDCFTFGLSNAAWSFIVFSILSGLAEAKNLMTKKREVI
jgi:hypothetical protein